MDAREPLIDRARTWAWVVAGAGIGILSLNEQFNPASWFHPLAPVVGLVASGIGLLVGLTMNGPTKAIMVSLGAFGLALNAVAAVLVVAGFVGGW